MSLATQVRIILVAGVLCLVGALYQTSMLMHWSSRSVEAKGTVVTIEGNSADNKPGPRRACMQTLHYRFAGPDGKFIAAAKAYGGAIAAFARVGHGRVLRTR